MKTKLLLFAFLCVLASCHKDHDEVKEEEILDPPVIQVTTRLVSRTDTTFDAARHATQTFAGSISPYSSFPYVVTRANQINRDFELITLTTQNGHQFHQVHSLVENDVNYLHWVLPALQTVQGKSDEDEHFTINEDFALNIPKGSLQYTNAAAFSGNYSITYALLDPTTFLADAIPSFLAFNQYNQKRALQIKSSFYITVSSASGEKLQFAPNATIKFTSIPEGDQWYFDAAKAVWKSSIESIDEKSLSLGSSSYYAIGVAEKPVRIMGSLRINNGLTPHYRITINYDGVARTVFTTNEGSWALYLPAGEEINVDVLLPCGNTFSTTLITPDEAEFEVPVDIQDAGCVNSVFTGTLRNDQGNELQEGFLLLGVSPEFIYTGKPSFSFNIPVCNATIVGVQGLDLATGQTGPVIQWESADSVQLYSVFACEQSKMEYLSLTVSGDTKMYWDLKTSVNQQSRLIIEEGPTEQALDLELAISGMINREYQDEELNIRFEDEHLGQRGYSMYCPTSTTGCGFSKFIITHYPESQGEWIRGYFEGEFWIKTFHPLTAAYKPVRGEFQVYRDF